MEKIIESQDTVTILGNDGWNSEVTKIEVWISSITAEWNEDGTDGDFQIMADLRTETGGRIRNATIAKPISVLDIENAPISVHDYIRDQVYNAVIAVNPFGLNVWNKLY